jgi:Cof subfamily protein (haloacid dehalogenase superfamily)
MPNSPLPYRAVALDMDGTLLDPLSRISPASLRVLRILSGRGIHIILASGRMTDRIAQFGPDLGIPLTIIAYNGAETLEGQGDVWQSRGIRGISARTRDTVFELCRNEGIFLNVYVEGKLHGYHPSGDFSLSLLYGAQNGADYVRMHSELESLPRENIAKLLTIGTPEDREKLFDSWRPLLSSHCSVVKSNPEYLEILGKGVSKGSALEAWLASKGLDGNHLIAFGDAENDLEMLRVAGLGIAMGNATPGLRATHSRVSAWTHAEDGVARELSAIFSLPPE